jgi:hypothetical protein
MAQAFDLQKMGKGVAELIDMRYEWVPIGGAYRRIVQRRSLLQREPGLFAKRADALICRSRYQSFIVD